MMRILKLQCVVLMTFATILSNVYAQSRQLWRAPTQGTKSILTASVDAVEGSAGEKVAFPCDREPGKVRSVAGDENWDGQFNVNGLDNTVFAIVVSAAGEVYVGGSFVNAGKTTVNKIAKWNGSSWTPLGSGLNGNVYALACSGTDLYVGGSFTAAGATSANRIAKWDGSAWSALGSGVNNWVRAIVVKGNEVYAGGDFTTAGGASAAHVAKWDGSSWSPMGTGITGGSMFKTVFAMGVIGANVFVGGDFSTAGGSPAKNIARWDGSSWSAMGTGVDNWGVQAMAVNAGDLYFGGWFSQAAGVSAHLIAKWNGSVCCALGSGPDNVVMGLGLGGGNVYAGGTFATAGGVSANHVAKWDGSAWAGLGSGVNDQVNAIAVNGNDVYVGGYFTTAGGKPSNHIARYNANVIFTGIADAVKDPPAFALHQNYPNPFNPRTTIRIEVPQLSDAVIQIFDVLGTEISTVLNGQLAAGSHSVEWNAETMPSGVYYCRLSACTREGNRVSQHVQIMKMVLLK